MFFIGYPLLDSLFCVSLHNSISFAYLLIPVKVQTHKKLSTELVAKQALNGLTEYRTEELIRKLKDLKWMEEVSQSHK